MTDDNSTMLVMRLRDSDWPSATEAADEIERLREELQSFGTFGVFRQQRDEIERLRAEIAYLREPDDRDDQIRFYLDEIARKDAALRNLVENIEHAFPSLAHLGPVKNARAALAPAQEKP